MSSIFFLKDGSAVVAFLPDLICIGGKIDFRLVVAVENSRLLVVKIKNGPLVFVLEKGLIGSNDLGILMETRSDTRPKPDQALNSVGRKERIAKNAVCLLPDAIHAAGSLDQADDCPWEVVVHDDGAIL